MPVQLLEVRQLPAVEARQHRVVVHGELVLPGSPREAGAASRVLVPLRGLAPLPAFREGLSVSHQNWNPRSRGPPPAPRQTQRGRRTPARRTRVGRSLRHPPSRGGGARLMAEPHPATPLPAVPTTTTQRRDVARRVRAPCIRGPAGPVGRKIGGEPSGSHAPHPPSSPPSATRPVELSLKRAYLTAPLSSPPT